MQVIVDSLLTRYDTQGKGKLVLLLHGWGDSAAGLRALQTALAKKYSVIALDLPGFGGTQAPSSAWGLDDYARFVDNFLTKIDAGKPYAIAGHSNGGAIVVRGLGRGWLGADKAILLASAGIRGEYKGRVKMLRLVAKAGKAITALFPKSLKQGIRKKAYKTIGSDMLVAEHLQETFKKVVTDDVRADAAKITAPTLIIYGADDESTPPRYGEIFHQSINGSRLEILPDAEHFVHNDQHEKVVKLMLEFLK